MQPADAFTITLIQPDICWEQPVKNLALYERLFPPQPTDAIILPEMFTTGFTMNAARVAEPMYGATMQWMQKMASALQCCIAGSLIIAENGHFYNRFVWVYPDENQEPTCYDKRHLFRMGKEHETYTPGNRQVYVAYKGWQIMLQVCYDLRFPVWSRNNPHNPYHLLLYVANWPQVRNYPWEQLLKARAIENLCYVAGVNRVGADGHGVYHSGNSLLLNFKGEPLWTKQDETAVYTHTLSYPDLEQFRQQFAALQDADKFVWGG